MNTLVPRNMKYGNPEKDPIIKDSNAIIDLYCNESGQNVANIMLKYNHRRLANRRKSIKQ